MEYELYHHGILGMKWGIRRYQNKDGSLTPTGKKRYASDSGEIIYKDLRKQVHDRRQKQSNWSNRFMRGYAIGENSKRVLEESDKKRKEYNDSPEVKAWIKKINDFDDEEYKKLDNGDMSAFGDEYQNKRDKLLDERPKQNYNDTSFTAIYKNGHWEYLDDYINRGGKDLSIAYIKDLGYDQKTAEHFVKEMIKKGRTLGDV